MEQNYDEQIAEKEASIERLHAAKHALLWAAPDIKTAGLDASMCISLRLIIEEAVKAHRNAIDGLHLAHVMSTRPLLGGPTLGSQIVVASMGPEDSHGS